MQQCEVRDCEYPHCPLKTSGSMAECPGREPMDCGHGLEHVYIVRHEDEVAPPTYYRHCAKCEEEAENADNR